MKIAKDVNENKWEVKFFPRTSKCDHEISHLIRFMFLFTRRRCLSENELIKRHLPPRRIIFEKLSRPSTDEHS